MIRFRIAALLLSTAVAAQAQQIHLTQGQATVEIQAVTPTMIRVHVQRDAASTPRTLVLDPALKITEVPGASATATILTLPGLTATVTQGNDLSLAIQDPTGHTLLTFANLVNETRHDSVTLVHDERDLLYGIHGTSRDDADPTILRTHGGTAAQGVQGDGGSPSFFSSTWGVLVDSDGGSVEPHDETLKFRHYSRPDPEFFISIGAPLTTISNFSLLTGRAPMPPRWTLGFLNSQWGSTENELRDVIHTYAAKQIPISGFILDFDWKAWGEDNYGEWRWNSQNGKGNAFPDKYPNGASGKFAADMLAQGIHLTGILKPRILVNTIDGHPTEAAAYATKHNLWYPNEKRDNDYFTHRLAGNIDFNNPEARTWYWDHLIPAFQTGITAWWNDEADYNSTTVFNNFQFLNMSRALYDGQRLISPERVWSINRAFYAGSVRYGAAEWSGDIGTGFQIMSTQRPRMIAALDTGLQHWSMDTGGFLGHPTDENYARWIEFAAFVPIMRVHGDFQQKRQPWTYGPIAEAAAKKAMRLRFDLLPYIYSNERGNTETGIGTVRPLFWAFPNDPRVVNDDRAWMFGDALLASPITDHAATTHTLYLPAGTWFDYWTGKKIAGAQELTLPADSKTWQDIPLFVRAGSILATQPTTTGNDLNPAVPLLLDIFPSATLKAAFSIYDDDGHTFAYESGAFFKQTLSATPGKITLGPVEGTYHSTILGYILRVHRPATTAITGTPLKHFPSEAAFHAATDAGWTQTHDRFGPVTLIRVPTATTATLTLK